MDDDVIVWHLNLTLKPPALCMMVEQLSGLRTETRTEEQGLHTVPYVCVSVC